MRTRRRQVSNVNESSNNDNTPQKVVKNHPRKGEVARDRTTRETGIRSVTTAQDVNAGDPHNNVCNGSSRMHTPSEVGKIRKQKRRNSNEVTPNDDEWGKEKKFVSHPSCSTSAQEMSRNELAVPSSPNTKVRECKKTLLAYTKSHIDSKHRLDYFSNYTENVQNTNSNSINDHPSQGAITTSASTSQDFGNNVDDEDEFVNENRAEVESSIQLTNSLLDESNNISNDSICHRFMECIPTDDSEIFHDDEDAEIQRRGENIKPILSRLSVGIMVTFIASFCICVMALVVLEPWSSNNENHRDEYILSGSLRTVCITNKCHLVTLLPLRCNS